MRHLILISILFFTASISFAGSGPSYLKCTSESGKTIFFAEIQDIDGGLTSANFKIEESEINFDWEDNASVVVDLENGVYTLTIESKNENNEISFIKLWGLPSTFKAIRNDRHDIKFNFKAKIEGTDPRPEKQYSPTIELNCTLEYQI